jgi:hypothetical protein
MVLTAEDPSFWVAWRSARLPAEDAQSLSVDGPGFGHQWVLFPVLLGGQHCHKRMRLLLMEVAGFRCSHDDNCDELFFVHPEV